MSNYQGKGVILMRLHNLPFAGSLVIDAAEVISFDEGGIFDADKTNRVLSARLKDCKCAVIPGF